MVTNNAKYAASIVTVYFSLLSRRYSGSVEFACGQVSTVSTNKVTQHSRDLADIHFCASVTQRPEFTELTVSCRWSVRPTVFKDQIVVHIFTLTLSTCIFRYVKDS